jgi:hypothetical protein
MEVVLLRRRDGDDVLDGLLFGRKDFLFQWGASFLGEGEGCLQIGGAFREWTRVLIWRVS